MLYEGVVKMTDKEYRHALDFAIPYIGIFQNEINKPILVILEDTPDDIRTRVNELWPTLVEETRRRHADGKFESTDYFM